MKTCRGIRKAPHWRTSRKGRKFRAGRGKIKVKRGLFGLKDRVRTEEFFERRFGRQPDKYDEPYLEELDNRFKNRGPEDGAWDKKARDVFKEMEDEGW